MNCQKCQKPLKENAKFCGSCGAVVDSGVEKTNNEEVVNKGPVKKSLFDQVISIIVWIAAFAIGRFLGLVVFLFIGAYLLGQWFPTWYLKRGKISTTLVKWIVWSNVLT